MSSLAQARTEIRTGNHAAAENILNSVLENASEITTDDLLDLTAAYEELYSATGRHEDLMKIARKCAERAQALPGIDFQIHTANALIVIAGAERALGRSEGASREARAAHEILSRFPPERFGGWSRERVNKIWLRLKSLQKAMAETGDCKTGAEPAPNLGVAEWPAFAAQKNISSRSLREFLANLRRVRGPEASAAILGEWAVDAPRAGNIGSTAELLSILVEDLTAVATAHPLPAATRNKLLRVIQRWEREQGRWLQRLFAQDRKLGLAGKLQRFRRVLETPLHYALDSIEKDVASLEPRSGGEILDGHEAVLPGLDARLQELDTGDPSSLAPRLNAVRERLDAVRAKVTQEADRRNEIFEHLLARIAQSADRSAFTALRADVKKRLPPAMQVRPELQQASHQAGDRIEMAEIEALERQERGALVAKLASVQGVNLVNLLFTECGIELTAARQLVIDHNSGRLDLEGLLDKVLAIKRGQRHSPRGWNV